MDKAKSVATHKWPKLIGYLLGVILLTCQTRAAEKGELVKSPARFELYLKQLDEVVATHSEDKSVRGICRKDKSVREIYGQDSVIRYYQSQYVSRISDGGKLTVSHKKFDECKEELIKIWQEKTGNQWPRYVADTECNVGGVVYRISKGTPYDVHHIIPQSYGGTNDIVNFFPLSCTQHNLVHGMKVNGELLKDPILCELFPLSMEIREPSAQGKKAFT